MTPFDPEKKIIEFQFRDDAASLVGLRLGEFVDELSLDSPAPGGGSAAALCGALSAALSSMVANLTVGKKGYEAVQAELKEVALKAQAAKDEMLRAIDEDTRAFNKVMDAFRLPGGSEDQVREKEAAVQRAYVKATRVPLGVLEKCVALLELAKTVAFKGNKNSLSDAGVAALAAEAAAQGAGYNVLINLPNIQDDMFREDIRRRARALLDQALRLAAEVKELVNRELEKSLEH